MNVSANLWGHCSSAPPSRDPRLGPLAVGTHELRWIGKLEFLFFPETDITQRSRLCGASVRMAKVPVAVTLGRRNYGNRITEYISSAWSHCKTKVRSWQVLRFRTASGLRLTLPSSSSSASLSFPFPGMPGRVL